MIFDRIVESMWSAWWHCWRFAAPWLIARPPHCSRLT